MQPKLWDRRRVLTGIGATGASVGEYDTYRAGMLMNSRPDGSFMNW